MMKRRLAIPLLSILIFTLVVNIGAIFLYRERNLQNYLAGSIDKTAMLASSQSPRIILVGGSNVAFGFRSDMIQQATGIRTINMGLQGSLGIRFSLNSLKPYLQKGDIVILSPEYNNFAYGFIGGDILSQYLILNPQQTAYISSGDEIMGILEAFPNTHTSAISNMINDFTQKGCLVCEPTDKVYLRKSFNPYGDIFINTGNPEPNIESLKLVLTNNSDSIAEGTLKTINDFAEFARARGVQVLLTYPSTSKITDPATVDFVARLDQKLRKELSIPILGNIQESQFEDRYMFNTYYHLNQDGAILHTQQLLTSFCSVAADITCKLSSGR